MPYRHAPALALVVIIFAAGCGESSPSDEELDQARQEGYEDGRRAGIQQSESAKDEHGDRRYDNGYADGYADGTNETLGGYDFAVGQNYIVDFQSSPNGLYVRGYIPMELGVPYTCNTLDDCNSPAE